MEITCFQCSGQDLGESFDTKKKKKKKKSSFSYFIHLIVFFYSFDAPQPLSLQHLHGRSLKITTRYIFFFFQKHKKYQNANKKWTANAMKNKHRKNT